MKIYVCDICGDKIGEIACSNSLGGSYCSVRCSDIAETEEIDTSEASPAVIEMLGNLAVRITDLERTNKRLLDEIDTLHANQKRLGEEVVANDYAIDEINGKLGHLEADVESKVAFDADEVIVELAKLLVEATQANMRKEGR